MTLRGVFWNSWFLRVVLVLWIVSSVFVFLLLGRIDDIVHQELYGYGLQFSFDWAGPYWAFLRMVYLCLAVPVAWSVVALVLSFWGRPDVDVKGAVERVERPVNAGVRGKVVRANGMVVSCPKCGRVFGKPLVMLDFGGKKARLVNVCPYCNRVLGSAEADEKKEVDVGVVGVEEREEEVRRT